MRLFRKFQTAILLLMALPLTSLAACIKSEPNSVWDYDGTIGDGYRVRMSLVIDGEKVNGVYFYASQLRDIAITGTIKNGTDIVLNELDGKGNVTARFEGQFAERDPKGRFGGGKLECETIVGVWQKMESSKQLPFYVSMEGGGSGSLKNRYALLDADDEKIHRSAFKFWDAVKRGDKKTVAAQIVYPIKVQVSGNVKRLRNSAELIANYDAIFSPQYREEIVNAIPRNMFVNYQGIMLGSGQVWFNPDGKVIALNNH